MKKILVLLIIFVSIMFLSCNDNNSTNADKMYFSSEEITLMVGEEKTVYAISTLPGNISYTSLDKSIATIDEFGTISAKKIGEVTIKATMMNNENVFAFLKVTVTEAHVTSIKVKGVKFGNVGEELSFSAVLSPNGISGVNFSWSSSDMDVLTIDNNGKATLVGCGISIITIKTDEAVPFEYSFEVGSFDFREIIVDDGSLTPNEDGSISYYDKTYYPGYTYVNSLKQALQMIKENGIVRVISGTIEENAIINKNGVSVYGENY